jgi:hypothetical protein
MSRFPGGRILVRYVTRGSGETAKSGSFRPRFALLTAVALTGCYYGDRPLTYPSPIAI